MTDAPELNFEDLSKEIENICKDLETLVKTPGPTRCIAKYDDISDQRIGRNKEFPFFNVIRRLVNRIIEDEGVNLTLFQDCGNIILLSGFKNKPPLEEIRKIPITLASHADEITFLVKKGSPFLIPLFNAAPLINFGISHPEIKVFGFRGKGDERELKEIGIGKLGKAEIEGKTRFFLESYEGKEKIEGDLVIQDYYLTAGKYGLDTIFHSKALDDRVGVLAHLYVLKELSKYDIKAKGIFVGDEEGVDVDISWARLARPVFKKYCMENNFIIITDGFDGKQLTEFYHRRGEHLDEALITPYRSEGKGAGDPGLFSLVRDYVVPLVIEKRFKAVTTTDYVSRSLDPKIMDDFPNICSIDWSNGPVLIPTKDFYPLCHKDESVAIRQVLNVIGTVFWTAYLFQQRIEL
jgi:hypothetical protein